MVHKNELEKLEQRYRENPSQWFAALADSYRKTGELELALEVVQSGIVDRPDYPSAQIVLGRVLLDLDRDAEAAQAFKRVLDLDAENIIALRTLSELSERQGDIPAARAWLRRLLEVDPLNEEAEHAVNRLAAVEPEVDEPVREASAPSDGAFFRPEELDPIAVELDADTVDLTPSPPDTDYVDDPVRSTDRRQEAWDVDESTSPGGGSAVSEEHVPQEGDVPSPAEADEAMSPAAEMEEDEADAFGFEVPDADPSDVVLAPLGADEDLFEIELDPAPAVDETAPIEALDASAVPEEVAPEEDGPEASRGLDATPETPTAIPTDFEIYADEEPLIDFALDEPEPLVEQSRRDDADADFLVLQEFDTSSLLPDVGTRQPVEFDFDLEDMFEDQPPAVEPLVESASAELPVEPLPSAADAHEDDLGSAMHDEGLVEATELDERPEAVDDVQSPGEPVTAALDSETPSSTDVTVPIRAVDPVEPEATDEATVEAVDEVDDRVGEPEPVVTSTMAEVYAQQGLRKEAEEIYARLLQEHPDDPDVAERLEELRSPGAGADYTPESSHRVSRFAVAHTGGVSARVALRQIFSARIGVGGGEEPAAPVSERDGPDDSSRHWREG